MIETFLHQDKSMQSSLGWKRKSETGRPVAGDCSISGGKGEIADTQGDLCDQSEGVPSIQTHVVHSPRSDEVGKVLHDFQ